MELKSINFGILAVEILRLGRLIPLAVASYAIITTAVYTYTDWYYGDDVTALTTLVDWAAIYAITVFAMNKAGLFHSGKRGGVGAYFVFGVVSGVAILLGLMLFVVPGILLAARWQPAVCDVLVRNDGPTRALDRAWQATGPSTAALVVHTLGAIGFSVSILLVWMLPDHVYQAAPLSFIVGSNFLASIGSLWLVLLPVASYGLLMAPQENDEAMLSPA